VNTVFSPAWILSEHPAPSATDIVFGEADPPSSDFDSLAFVLPKQRFNASTLPRIEIY
jgi:hypothetical protein